MPRTHLYSLSLMAIMGMVFFSATSFAQHKKKSDSFKSGAPLFTQFYYKGNDAVYEETSLKDDEFYNPILQGCYPDPSITRRGDDYFMVNSSFAMFPGVPIFHSTDLVNWKQIGHVLDRPSQLKVETAGVSRGIYAPAIRYNKYNETFYMITTQISGGIGNMVVKTKDPFKGWGEVIPLKFDGIDPSLFFDDDGKAYVVHNDAPDEGKELYSGHRVIKLWEYDLQKDEVVPGTDVILVDGGVDISQKPIWIEGPHLYKKNGKYYLMCAEGGTGDWHSEVIFISDHPKGPYIPAPNNPILTQRYLSNDRKNKVEWTGHADLVEGKDGNYYGVFLGIRPNAKKRVNTGRETFILPVDWSGNFPVFENGLVPLSPKLKMPSGVVNRTGEEGFMPNGNFTFTDDFTDAAKDLGWISMRHPKENFISLTEKGLLIRPYETNIKAQAPAAILFRRQQHASFEARTTMIYKPESERDLAGLTCYQGEKFHYVLGVTKRNNSYWLVLTRTESVANSDQTNEIPEVRTTIVASASIDVTKPVHLQVVANRNDEYQFGYSTDGMNFLHIGDPVSGDILSTNVAGGFTGALIGLYATKGNDIRF